MRWFFIFIFSTLLIGSSCLAERVTLRGPNGSILYSGKIPDDSKGTFTLKARSESGEVIELTEIVLKRSGGEASETSEGSLSGLSGGEYEISSEDLCSTCSLSVDSAGYKTAGGEEVSSFDLSEMREQDAQEEEFIASPNNVGSVQLPVEDGAGGQSSPPKLEDAPGTLSKSR